MPALFNATLLPALFNTTLLPASFRDGNQCINVEPGPLEKYTKDLTAAAREGKLDPVVGRNEEIRRCINILSRWGWQC